MSPEQSQYIWRKTIPHIEAGMGSGVFTSYRSAIFLEDLLQYSQLPWKIDVLVKVENVEKKGTTITISRDALGLFFTLLAAGFIVAYRLLLNFGVFSQGLSIAICLATYSLAILGIVFVALRDRKFTPALWLSILVLAVATITV